ncbi:MAG: O-antigen ligase family protein [Candidatus Aminicenantia bacterium]
MNLKKKNFLEIFIFLSFTLFIFFIPVSVSFAQIFLTLSLFGFLYSIINGKFHFKFPSFFISLIIFSVIAIISTFFSIDFKTSLNDLKEILLFLTIPLVFNSFKNKEDFKIFNYTLSLSIIFSAAMSVLEYSGIFLEKENRVSGFLSHYMTQAGILMLFTILSLSSYFLEKGKRKILWFFLFLISIFSLLLTLTRSAWIGVIFGITLISILYRPKLILVLASIFLILALLSPEQIKKRFLSTFDLQDETVKERIYMAKAGIKIIFKYPLLGSGLDTAEILYKKFKPPEAIRDAPHLHNNILQIGSELGIPALLAWFLFVYSSFVLNFKIWKISKDDFTKFSSLAGVGVILSFFIAGLFEYNFGDSEVKMLFLYLITYPATLWEMEKKNEIKE